MKKVIGVIIGILLIATPLYAGELEEAQLQMKNIELEYQLLQARQQVLQYQAKELQIKIATLKAEKKAQPTKEVK